MVDRSYVARNEAARERLRAIVSGLSDAELGKPLGGGWTVAAALAHVAFWDRFALARMEWAAGDGTRVPAVLDDELEDLINAAGMDDWRTMPPRAAAQAALDAAAALDQALERLDAAVVEAVLAEGRIGLLDRARHRGEHLDEIERTLAG